MGFIINSIWVFAACLWLSCHLVILIQLTNENTRSRNVLHTAITQLKETKCKCGSEIEVVGGKLTFAGYTDGYNTDGFSGRDSREQTWDGSPTIDGVDGANGPTIANIKILSNNLQPMSDFTKNDYDYLISNNGKFKVSLTSECNLQVDHKLYSLVHQLPFKCLYLQFTGRSMRGSDVYTNGLEPEVKISDNVVFLKLFDDGKLAYVNKNSGKVEKVLIKSILK